MRYAGGPQLGQQMHFHRVRRREFITLLGGAVSWPLAARAQQAMPAIGFLASQLPDAITDRLRGFRQGLKDTGYVEGENAAIVYRFAENQDDRLPTLAAELVSRPVAVIATAGAPPTFAATAATTTVPIVFLVGDDPARLGLVTSLSRPGGNITGVNILTSELAAKRLELLHELLPQATRVAVLVNPANAVATEIPLKDPVEIGLVSSLNHPGGNLTGVAYLNAEVAPKRLELLHELVPTARSIALLVNTANPVAAGAETKVLQAVVNALGLHLQVVNSSNALQIEDAFAALVQDRVEALQVGVDPLFGNHINQLVALATRRKIPTIYPWREFTVAGGLMSYGSSIPDAFHQVGVYTGRILKGAKPADLPVQRPTKLRLVLNLKAAKAIGLNVPATVLARADEVIE